eukprot:5780411-Pyramimonas_sp.AAC.1
MCPAASTARFAGHASTPAPQLAIRGRSAPRYGGQGTRDQAARAPRRTRASSRAGRDPRT